MQVRRYLHHTFLHSGSTEMVHLPENAVPMVTERPETVAPPDARGCASSSEPVLAMRGIGPRGSVIYH